MPSPSIDNRIFGKVFFCSNTEVPERIKKLFTYTCYGVAEQLQKDELLSKTHSPLNCIFTDYGKVAFELDEEQFGNVMGLIIFPIKKWLENGLSDLHILLCMTEELCHFLWGINDEVEVNYKVLSVIQNIMPAAGIQMSDLYNVDWMEEEMSKNKKEPKVR